MFPQNAPLQRLKGAQNSHHNFIRVNFGGANQVDNTRTRALALTAIGVFRV